MDQNINSILNRGVENVYPTKEALQKVLASDKKIRIYYGIDPTGKLHLGHVVQLLKLGQLQKLGHEIIILIGDFTARIGDPTDKKAARKKLTRAEVKAHSRDYKKVIGRIIDIRRAKVRFLHNEKWTNKLTPEDMLELASNFTVSQLLERDMFQERIKAGKEIYLHEFLYPVFQAYDAVTLDVDMQIGGNDQTFNMLAGRTLMKRLKSKEKFVLTTKMLVDQTGKKMGKTEGNFVPLEDSPIEMFGKIMSWSDGLIINAFELLTDVPLDKIAAINKKIESNQLNPRDAKLRLAGEITKLIWGVEGANKGREYFTNVFIDKNNPTEIKSISAKNGESLTQLLVREKIINSNSEVRRLIVQGGIKIDHQTIDDINYNITSDGLLQIGKRTFINLVITK